MAANNQPRVDPLQQQVFITEKDGKPTPFMIRQWNNLRDQLAALQKFTTESIDGIITPFTALSDTPNDYTGDGSKYVAVKASEDGLEFITPPAAYTDEQAQDAVGGILDDSSNVTLTYSDATPSITADLVNTAVTPASYGSVASGGSVEVPYFTVDAKGRLTAAAEQSLALFLDIALFVQGTMTNGELVLRLEAPRAFTLPASLTGSQASAGTASTGNASFDIKKNGGSVGSVTFNASASGSFTFSSSQSFAAGDLLEIVAPSTADGTLADVSITLVGTR